MISDNSLEGFREFEFGLTDALIRQLIICLDDMGASPLVLENTNKVPNAQGVYQLFYKNKLVYIGKTDSDAGLQSRLNRHAVKILSRLNLSPEDVRFKAVKVLVFSAMELETMLIKHYENLNEKPSWNHSGFGSNDPGRNRDTSTIKAEHFDYKFPINLDYEIDLEIVAGMTVWEALGLLKINLPYLLRFQKKPTSIKKELSKAIISADINAVNVRDLLLEIMSFMPIGWQLTALPGYIILYKEEASYKHGKVLSRT